MGKYTHYTDGTPIPEQYLEKYARIQECHCTGACKTGPCPSFGPPQPPWDGWKNPTAVAEYQAYLKAKD